MKEQFFSKALLDKMFTQEVTINSKQQFGPNALMETNENQGINLGYGLDWGLLDSSYGIGIFKEGYAEGFQHYSILFPETGIGVVIISNSNNAESIFKELLEYTIADTYTPWKWEKLYTTQKIKNLMD